MELNLAEKRALLDEVNRGVISHAYIIEGALGVGKRSFARLLAKAILCTASHKPCGACTACRKCDGGVHPDLHVYGADGASFKVDLVREIKRAVNLTPNEGARAVYILEGAQAMTVAAQNALLKVFEEPPEGTTFLLVTEKKEALLPTVRSRGRIVRLSAADDETVRAVLKEKFPTAKDKELEEAVRIAAGCVGVGEAVLKKEGKAERESALKLCTAIYGDSGRYALYNAFLGQMKKRDALIPVMDALAAAARDVLVCKLACGEAVLLPSDTAREFAETATAKTLYDIFEAALECGRSLRRNTDPGIAVSQLCVSINRAKG